MSDRSAATSSSSASSGRFVCEACGKSYKWKPELGGHKVKCTCGHVMKAPPAPPPPPPPPSEDDDLIPFSDETTSEPPVARAQVRRPVVDHDHTVHGHQILAGTSMGEPAMALPPDPDPPPAPKPPPTRPAHGKQTAVRVQSSMIPHEWSKPAPESPKWPLVVVGVVLAGLITAIVLMIVL